MTTLARGEKCGSLRPVLVSGQPFASAKDCKTANGSQSYGKQSEIARFRHRLRIFGTAGGFSIISIIVFAALLVAQGVSRNTG